MSATGPGTYWLLFTLCPDGFAGRLVGPLSHPKLKFV